MVEALAALVGAQLLGEVLRQAFHLPLPGPVIGLFLLVTILSARGRTVDLKTSQLPNVANAMITNMGVLFVPAGVGIITESHLLREYWLPITAGLILSTVLGLLVTALMMHYTLRKRISATVPEAP